MLQVLREDIGVPEGIGASVNAIQTFGTWLDYHSHIHMVVAWGLFDARGNYTGASKIPAKVFEVVFSQKLFDTLILEGMISEELKAEMRQWHHSGFGVFVGELLPSNDTDALESVVGYIVKGPLSLNGLKLDGEFVELHGPKNKKHPKYPGGIRRWYVMDFLADLVMHIPDKDVKMTIYYGWYSNRSRGYRKQHPDEFVTKPVDGEVDSTVKSGAYWARYIEKVYECDPLECEHCGGKMREISRIFNVDVIFKILSHLGLLGKDWQSGADPP